MTSENNFIHELDKLKESGYTYNFINGNDFLYCSERELNFRRHELIITEHFRFEDRDHPSTNTVLYLIESEEYGLKGFLVN